MELKAAALVCINGVPGQGKTELLRATVKKTIDELDIYEIYALTAVPWDYAWLQDDHVIGEWDGGAPIRFLLRECSKDKAKGLSRLRMLIIDDFHAGKAFHNSDEVRSLASLFRNVGLIVIVVAQEPVGVPPAMRQMATHAIMFPVTADSAIKVLYTEYGQYGRHFRCADDLRVAMEKLSKHTCIVFSKYGERKYATLRLLELAPQFKVACPPSTYNAGKEKRKHALEIAHKKEEIKRYIQKRQERQEQKSKKIGEVQELPSSSTKRKLNSDVPADSATPHMQEPQTVAKKQRIPSYDTPIPADTGTRT